MNRRTLLRLIIDEYIIFITHFKRNLDVDFNLINIENSILRKIRAQRKNKLLLLGYNH
jgi:hypothetical protein